MKVSWIDPDAFRSLADSLLEPEQRELAVDDKAASEIDLPPPPEEVASFAAEIPELRISTENLHQWDEDESPYMPDPENLEQIRRVLENLSDRASNAGIIRDVPFEEEEPSPSASPESTLPSPSEDFHDEVDSSADATTADSSSPTQDLHDPAPIEAHSYQTPEELNETILPPEPQAQEVPSFQAPAETHEQPQASTQEAPPSQQVGLQDLKNLIFGIAPVTTHVPVPKPNEPQFDEASLQLPEWPAPEQTEELPAFTPKPPPVDVPPLAFDGVLPTSESSAEPNPNAFTSIEGDLAARLDHYVSWACHLTGALEALILDQHGDLIWGHGRCSDLVASSILAINTQWRSSAMNLAQRYPHLIMRLNEKRVLAILPCTTRFGQITLGLVLTEAIEAPRAAELAEALIATVNHESA